MKANQKAIANQNDFDFVLENHNIVQLDWIDVIDNHMKRCYDKQNYEYLDAKGVGKFRKYCQQCKINDDFNRNVSSILDLKFGNPNDCDLLYFDRSFPIGNPTVIQKEMRKALYLYAINKQLKHCKQSRIQHQDFDSYVRFWILYFKIKQLCKELKY